MGQHLPPLHIKDLLYTATHKPGFVPIGRKPELDQIARILKRVKNNNAIIVGKSGVGKTVLIQGLATSLAQRKYPALRPLPLLEWQYSDLFSRLNVDNSKALFDNLS